MQNNIFPVKLLEEKLKEAKEIKHYIATDCQSEQVSAYVLCRSNGKDVFEILNTRTLKKEDFEQEVNNIVEYFNAEILL